MSAVRIAVAVAVCVVGYFAWLRWLFAHAPLVDEHERIIDPIITQWEAHVRWQVQHGLPYMSLPAFRHFIDRFDNGH